MSCFKVGWFLFHSFPNLFVPSHESSRLESISSEVEQALLFYICIFFLQENLILKLPVPFVDEGELLQWWVYSVS